MSEALNELRSYKGKNPNPRTKTKCALCGSPPEVGLLVQIRERGMRSASLATHMKTVCAECAVRFFENYKAMP